MEVDKIKYSDLFDGDPFEKANKSVLDFIKSLENLKNINKDLAKTLKEALETVSKTNVEELEKVEKLLKISQLAAKQNREIDKKTQEITKQTTKEIKKQVDLTYDELVAAEKLKIQKAETTKKAKEQAKAELGLLETQEKQIGAYARLDKRLKELRQVYKDIAAEAATLAVTGENPEKLAELTKELEKLQPEIERLDKTLKQIDENVGQFQRQVGSYKQAIKESFDETKGKISDNAKAILGLDERFDGLSEGINRGKENFKSFAEEIKNGEGRAKAFLNLLKNIGKAGLLGIALTLLTTLQATAKSLGGIFEAVQDQSAGAGQAITATTNKVVLLAQGLFTLDSQKIKNAWDLNIGSAYKLGVEIARLTRLLETLQATANNAYGNIASDIETVRQIQQNAFKSDQERFAAAQKAFELQEQETSLRLFTLELEKKLREQELKTAIEITNANKNIIDQILFGNLSYQERLDLLESLPTQARDATIELEEVLGNIEVEQEKQLRNRIDFQNFLFEQQFKNLEIVINKELVLLKKNLELSHNAINENLSFKDTIAEVNKLIDIINKDFVSIFDKILKTTNINLKEFNGNIIESFDNVEDLQLKLIELGIPETQRALLLDVFNEFKDISADYNMKVTELKKAEQEAIRDGIKRIGIAKEALDIQEKEFELAKLRKNIAKGGIDSVALTLQEDKLLFEIRNKRVEQLKKNLAEELKNNKLTNEQRKALELEYRDKINQITQEYELEREQREIERLNRVKTLTQEIIQLEQERFTNRISLKISKLEQDTLINLAKIKKLYLDIQQVELDRLIKERDSLLSFAQTEEEKLLIFKKFNEKKLQLEEQYQNKFKELNKKALNEALDFSQKVLSETQNQIQQQFQNRTQSIERQINSLNDALQKERELATKGVAANIDELEKRITELEIKRREEAKKEQAIQLGLAFINSVASYAKTNPQTAVQNAFRDILLTKILASVISGAFAEGVENFQGKGTETSDSNLVLISKGESIITARATKQYAGLASAMNSGEVDKWVSSNYSTTVNVDELGNLITHEISNAGKRIVKSLRNRPKL